MQEKTDMEVQESGVGKSNIDELEVRKRKGKTWSVILEGGAGRNRGKMGSLFFSFQNLKKYCRTCTLWR